MSKGGGAGVIARIGGVGVFYLMVVPVAELLLFMT